MLYKHKQTKQALHCRLGYEPGNFSTDYSETVTVHITFHNFSTQKKNHYLQYSQKGPVVFTRSAQVLAQLFMLLNTKQGIL